MFQGHASEDQPVFEGLTIDPIFDPFAMSHHLTWYDPAAISDHALCHEVSDSNFTPYLDDVAISH